MLTGAGGQELFGHGFSLGQVAAAEDGSGPIFINDHGGSRVDAGSIQHRLPEFLHVPGCHWLRVRQLGSKNLDEPYKMTFNHPMWVNFAIKTS